MKKNILALAIAGIIAITSSSYTSYYVSAYDQSEADNFKKTMNDYVNVTLGFGLNTTGGLSIPPEIYQRAENLTFDGFEGEVSCSNQKGGSIYNFITEVRWVSNNSVGSENDDEIIEILENIYGEIGDQSIRDKGIFWYPSDNKDIQAVTAFIDNNNTLQIIYHYRTSLKTDNTDTESDTIDDNQEAADSTTSGDNTDEEGEKKILFRDYEWGTSYSDVLEKETEGLKQNVDYALQDDVILIMNGSVGGYDANYSFIFKDNKLDNAAYVLAEEHTSDIDYYNDYVSLVEKYKKVYGEPDIEEANWKDEFYKDKPSKWGLATLKGDVSFHTIWTDSTGALIFINFSGDNYDPSTAILYFAPQHTSEENTDGI